MRLTRGPGARICASRFADFASALARIRSIGIELMSPDPDPGAWTAIRDAHLQARMHYERLRLTSSSLDVQEAARRALSYTYGIQRQAEGKPLRDDECAVVPHVLLQEALLAMYVTARRELGIPRPGEIYREPDEWLGPAAKAIIAGDEAATT